MAEELLKVENMYKNFGVTVALNNVSFEVERGYVYGLIGENGSGKSTVSSIIAGMQPATKGEMYYKGQPWNPSSMLEAQENKIGMIVQEAGTIPNITVAENIFLGHENLFKKGLFVDKGAMEEAAQKLLDELELSDMFKPNQRTATLDAQARKIIEIAKCLYWEPELLIVDETSTALSFEGREFLYRILKKMKSENKSVLFISHDLDEMMEHCDKLTVLRDGVIIGTLNKDEYEPGRIRQMMVGRDIQGDYYRSDVDGYSDEVVLEARHITTMHDLLCFDLELHKGEILGLGGLSHCGMHTVGRALFGVDKIVDGEVIVNGNKITSPKVAIANKMGYVSKNRDQESLGLSATIAENIASTGYRINELFKGIISFKKEGAYVDKQIEALAIKCAGKNYKVNTLSGGNKQKVVIGKWLGSDSQILVLDCPTRGIDVGVKASMYQLMYEMKKAGKSIILISEELSELIGMSDRILMMKDGKVTAERLRVDGLSEHDLIEYMI